MGYRTVLIEENQVMQERLSSVIRNTPGFELNARYRNAGDALGQMQAFKPELILLDIDLDRNSTLLPDLKKAYPHTVIIGMSRRWDAEAQSRLLQSGAGGFMVKPFSGEELQETLKNLQNTSASRNSEVIAFFSPKGKSGKTTLIANLGAALAQQTGEPVAIIDGDLQFGDMGVFFNLTPQSTIVEAIRDISFLSPVTLKSYFVPVNEELSVLCGAAKPDLAETVTMEGITSLIEMARGIFRYVLVDLSSGFSDVACTACELADKTLVMAMVNGGYEVEHMKRALEIFKAWEDCDRRVKPVFTRVNPCTEEARKEFSQALGFPVFQVLPNEYLAVSSAADNGRLLLTQAPENSFSQAVEQMAGTIKNW